MKAWQLAAREAIRDTIARYAHAADGGRFEELAACFTAEGVLEVVGSPPERAARLVGRAAIRDYLGGVGRDLSAASTVPRIRHHVSSTRIDVTGRSEATARSYFFVVTERGPDHWGRYRDTLVPLGDRWLFAHRLARTEGFAPGSWAGEQGG